MEALELNGYVERSFYSTPVGGVAIVTRLERIKDDGSPSGENDRWPEGVNSNYDSGDLFRFLRGLFFVDPGHYRVIVFVLQVVPFKQSPNVVTGQTALAWLHGGANVLPAELAASPFTGGYCTVLIYEFASDGVSVRVVPSHLTGKRHLEKSGVLADLTKRK